MKAKKVNYYFKNFIELFKYTTDAAKYLGSVIEKFDGGISEAEKDEMHVIEHSADLCLHDVLSRLAKEFITPIENEDILAIVKKIDDATDTIEDVLIKTYMHDVKKLPSCAKEFVEIIKRECDAMSMVLDEFANFKKSNIIREKIMEVLNIEEEGDKLYISSIRELYQRTKDFGEIYVTEDLINAFEACCDIIEEVAQVVDEAIMKNS